MYETYIEIDRKLYKQAAAASYFLNLLIFSIWLFLFKIPAIRMVLVIKPESLHLLNQED